MDNIALGSRKTGFRAYDATRPILAPNKRITDEEVLDIHKDRSDGMTYREIMAKYGIDSKGTLSYIINKRAPFVIQCLQKYGEVRYK